MNQNFRIALIVLALAAVLVWPAVWIVPQYAVVSRSSGMLLAGLVLLILGADGLVRGAASLAGIVGVSRYFIGLTVVAFGTSAPELAAAIGATFRDQGAIAIGNVLGSNLANLGLILGATAVVATIKVERTITRVDLPLLIVVSVLASIPLLDGFFARNADGSIGPGTVSLLDGILLTTGLVAFVWFNARTGRVKPEDIEAEIEIELGSSDTAPRRAPTVILKNLAFLAAGFVGLVVGADLLVDGSVDIANHFGVPEVVIGLTLVAIGTSVPELAFSIRAAQQGHADLALGNVLGSNAFNLLSVVGIAALCKPFSVPPEAAGRDIWGMLLFTVLIWIIAGVRHRLGRTEGIVLLVAYAAYMGLVILPTG